MNGWQIVLAGVYCIILAAVSYTDLRERRIPNKIIVPALILALGSMFFTVGWTSALLGGLVGALVMLIPVFAFGGHGGMGDVKLALFIGLILGFPDILFALILAHLLAVTLWLGVFLKRLDRKSLVPFAPFLAAGALLFLLLPYWL